MKIAIGNDHDGYEMKIVVLRWLKEQGYKLKNFGANSPFVFNYPDYVQPVVNGVNIGEFDVGVIICGDGQKISFAENEYREINAALCWSKEISQFSREHNNANILCLPGKLLSDKAGIGILKSFLETPIGGSRSNSLLEYESV